MVSLPRFSSSPKTIQKIALLGTCLPRKCGIATFTADLSKALCDLDLGLTVESIAMIDRTGIPYPKGVRFQISESDLPAYRQTADLVNQAGYDILSVQHEYGIFGGEAGSYLMNLVREVNMPVVTTLHTVLENPSPAQKRVMDELLGLSERVVVMSQRAVGFLHHVHQVPPCKIDLIPHGIPVVDLTTGANFRDTLGIKGPMILTFGLLSPDKGIQFMIQAMVPILAKHPDAVYVVVGATHPNIAASTGEGYRESLVQMTKDLGIEHGVRFVDRFVSSEELAQYLGAMDYYVTPYLNPKQITSGTLAYSFAAGKAVISTPYCYAEELLADGRGVLVPFRNSEALANAILHLEANPEERSGMAGRAAEHGAQMGWHNVGMRYLASFSQAKRESAARLRSISAAPVPIFRITDTLPPINLTHLQEISDDTGIIQHATFTTPNRSEGYCVDDNARALLLTSQLEGVASLTPEQSLLQSRYLSFVLDAFNQGTGRFRNFMSYSRDWLEATGSEDSQGRALWALAACANRTKDISRREVAKELYERAAPALLETTSLRTWAYGVIAADEYLQRFPKNASMITYLGKLADRLVLQYENYATEPWPWFEPKLTYANARIPQALIIAGDRLGNSNLLETGLKSLAWLMALQTAAGGVFAPISSKGFSFGDERSFFDQQPIEAWSTVSACLAGYRVSGNPIWLEESGRAFSWFLGRNLLQISVGDPSSGGCHDGLHVTRINRNQGAESTLAWLCALTEIQLARQNPISSPVRKETFEIN